MDAGLTASALALLTAIMTLLQLLIRRRIVTLEQELRKEITRVEDSIRPSARAVADPPPPPPLVPYRPALHQWPEDDDPSTRDTPRRPKPPWPPRKS